MDIIVKNYFLILARIGTVFVFFPYIGSRMVPNIVKVFLIFSISLLIFLYNGIKIINFNNDILFFQLLIKEIIIGLMLGFVIQLPLTALKIAGDIISFKTMFSIASVFDPMQEQRNTLWGEFFNVFGFFVLFSTGAYIYMINGIIYSFKVVDINYYFEFNDIMFKEIISVISKIMFIGIAISIPVVIILFVINLCMSIIAKTMLHFNVFFIGIPLQILVALIILIFSVEANARFIQNIFNFSFRILQKIINLI